ncbi:hypothetical protein D3C78_96670 [compost metagenome]
MEIQKIPTLAEKQEFWAEQLPNFEATYWLPSHFEYVDFDIEQGNYVIKDGLNTDLEEDATEIWHRVNTGWAMWKKAINFSRKQAQVVPEEFVLVPQESLKVALAWMHEDIDPWQMGGDSFADLYEHKPILEKALVESQEQSHE